MSRYLYFSVVLLLTWGSPGSCVRAQDGRFHQLSAARQLINPAFTGVMRGSLKAEINYQERYASLLGPEAFRTAAAGIELRRPGGLGNFFGIGLQVQQDEAGTSDFKRTQALAGFSYQQQIAGSRRGRGPVHFLTGGAQFGFGQRGYDLNKLWFSAQYFVDPTSRDSYIDRSLATGEPFGGQGSRNYLDLNAGFGWFAQFGERAGAYLGVAAAHLTTPNVSPVPDADDLLYRRYTVHGGGELPLGSGDVSLLPGFRYTQQGPSREGLIGSSIRYTERNWREVALRMGLFAYLNNQATDALGLGASVISAALETDRFQFAVSYDLTMGNLRRLTDSRGGFELRVVYVRPANYRQRVICPTF